MPAAAPAQQGSGGDSLFQFLLGRIGLSGALQIINLLTPGTSSMQKGMGAAGLAGTAARALGYDATLNQLFGTQLPDKIAGQLPLGGASAVGTALAGAGLGYDLSQIAGNSNYSTGQKVGHAVFDTGSAVAGAYNPYIALGLLARGVVGQLTRSGSPQVAATGRALQGPALPVEGLINVITGDMTPREAGNAMIAQTGQIPVVGHAMKQALQVFGLGTPPTTGTMVRKEVGDIANQIPALKGFQMGQDVLNADQYNAYKPETQKNAYALADLLGSYAPDYKKNQPAYQVQLGNSLLKQYGDNIPDIIKQVLTPQAQVTPGPVVNSPLAPGVIPPAYLPMTARGQFQPGLPNSTPGVTGNKLAGIMATLR